MFHPFQCSTCVDPSETSIEKDHRGLILWACGPKILSWCRRRELIAAEWSANPANAGAGAETNDENEGPPSKKRKQGNPATKLPSVLKLATAKNGKHVVAVTDDKFIRVFEVREDGQLVELSQRCMPKRPCAIDITPDNTILCGDKFGDVYSLPLLVCKDVNGDGIEDTTKTEPRPEFKPSATNLTVHTKQNRLALESQMKQKSITPRKDPVKFDHKLLLGHVSMLTDMKFASRMVDGRTRDYIITADRDEHIRVSRGPPQAHVIEGYCLGHTEFISKICLVPETDMLISGGGDDWIGVWDWPSQQLVRKLDLRQAIKTLANAQPTSVVDETQISVSGIWSVRCESSTRDDVIIAVACEKIPALFIAEIPKARDVAYPGTQLIGSQQPIGDFAVLSMGAPPLDILQAGGHTFVSMDVRRELRESNHNRVVQLDIGRGTLNSTKPPSPNMQENGLRNQTAVRALSLDLMPLSQKALQALNIYQLPDCGVTDKDMDDLLYGFSNLRKRGNTDDGPGADAALEG